jgi:hypothetical protein
LDYVGHAALTDRLLDCDPLWNWEPVAFGADGLPIIDRNGGMWIKLTVCNHTRLGYGHPDGKQGGDAVKEIIGDALRNAAMRFGAALDLWHKGDLHGDDEPAAPAKPAPVTRTPSGQPAPADIAIKTLSGADSVDQLKAIWFDLPMSLQALPEVIGAKEKRKDELKQPAQTTADMLGDDIPEDLK